MHELDLFYFSKPLFNTRGSAESKKLIQSLLLCTAASLAENVKMSECMKDIRSVIRSVSHAKEH